MPYTLTEEQTKQIKERYASVMYAFNELKNIPSNINGFAVLMQPDLLYCVVTSWVIDESRHIDFHNCNELELHKKVSYFMYWFSHLKPIQVLSVANVSDSRVALINEIFALRYAFRMLGIKGSKVVPSKLYMDLVYMLRYRKFTAESIFPMMRLLEMSAKNIGLSSY